MNTEALENLVRVHKLHHEVTDFNEVQGLIRSGSIRLRDARLESLSLARISHQDINKNG